MNDDVKNIKLDLGSSSSQRQGFIGIDITNGSDIKWDLTKGIPYNDDSVEEIRSDHFFEHLVIDDLLFVLSECHRVLKKGKDLNFTIPHINPYINAYIENDMKFLRSKITDVPKEYKKVFDTPFDIIMWLMYRNGEHKTFFDKESIVSKLKHTGFKKVRTREYDKESDINKRFSSIYIVATK